MFYWQFFHEILLWVGIKHVTTTPYYPHRSHAERVHRNLRSDLIAYHADNQTTWDKNLTWLQLAFNTATHEATEHTPLRLYSLLGRGRRCWTSGKFRNCCLKSLRRDSCGVSGMRCVGRFSVLICAPSTGTIVVVSPIHLRWVIWYGWSLTQWVKLLKVFRLNCRPGGEGHTRLTHFLLLL
jgi:hypothetical protein